MSHDSDKNSMVYLLAGFGLGAIVGAAAGLLFAPKEGKELRGEIGTRVKELKDKSQEWVHEQKAKRHAIGAAVETAIEEAGA